MGLFSTQDEYCSCGDADLREVNCVKKVVDDILVYSRTPQENLNTVLNVSERYWQQCITFKSQKFEYLKSSLDYVGYKVIRDGVKADPKKIEVIQNFPAPTITTKLCSFMRLANQLGGFWQYSSKAAETLRDSTKLKNTFLWISALNAAFEETKQVLFSPPVLAPFDPRLPTMLQTDASRQRDSDLSCDKSTETRGKSPALDQDSPRIQSRDMT